MLLQNPNINEIYVVLSVGTLIPNRFIIFSDFANADKKQRLRTTHLVTSNQKSCIASQNREGVNYTPYGNKGRTLSSQKRKKEKKDEHLIKYEH